MAVEPQTFEILMKVKEVLEMLNKRIDVLELRLVELEERQRMERQSFVPGELN